MIVFQLKFFMSQKRLSTWRQHFPKNVYRFLANSSKLCIFRIIRFCSNFTGIEWSEYLKIMYEETLAFQYQRKKWQHALSKNKFCCKFSIKALPCHGCKWWHGKSKVSPYIIWYVDMLIEFEPNRLCLAKKKPSWRHFAGRFYSWKNFNDNILIFRLLYFN